MSKEPKPPYVFASKYIKLIVFDLDGTLVELNTVTPLPNVIETLDLIRKESPDVQFAIATNQGGVGWRYMLEQDTQLKTWWEAKDNYVAKLPTEESVRERMQAVANLFGIKHIYTSFNFRTSMGTWAYSHHNDDEFMSPEYSPTWRKPNTGMIEQAVFDTGTHLEDVLVVGDRMEDSVMARSVGADFLTGDFFFNRD